MTDWPQNAKHLVCPECGFEYQHFGRPEYTNGNDNHEAGWGGRGDLIVVPIEGECGSKWEFCLGFHKGDTYLFQRLIQSCKYKGDFVYFIEAVGTDKIKIGVSKEPEERLKQLSTGSVVPLKLLGKVPGDAKTEKELQSKFDHFRHDKEWFFASKELREYVLKNAT